MMRRKKLRSNLLVAFLNDTCDWSCEYAPGRGSQIISLMAAGDSFASAATKMRVSPDTMREWAKNHPEFAEALERAKGLRLFYLERQLHQARDARTVNATIRALQKACPEEWGTNTTRKKGRRR